MATIVVLWGNRVIVDENVVVFGTFIVIFGDIKVFFVVVEHIVCLRQNKVYLGQIQCMWRKCSFNCGKYS